MFGPSASRRSTDQPAAKRRRRAQPAQPLERRHEDILRQVFGLARRHARQQNTVDHPGVAYVQFAERPAVPFRRRPHQVVVFVDSDCSRFQLDHDSPCGRLFTQHRFDIAPVGHVHAPGALYGQRLGHSYV